MNQIRLERMKICNFKGIRELDITFNGKDTDVLGDNGTGKTTIIDSFTWLLFGKDSLGRADFGIKPTDKAGNIIHQLETSVEAVFDISGIQKVFKKTMEEVWTRKRGAAEAEFTRNENGYFIDGVPKKKAEYTAVITELIDEEVFKIITNPFYFNDSMNWRDRRNVLLAICGEISDDEVICANPELLPLMPHLQGKSVSDFKTITANSMKRINQELDMIPVKINEAEMAKPFSTAQVVDTERRDALEKEIEELKTKKNNIVNGMEITQERQKIKLLEMEYNAVGSDYVEANTPEAVKIADLNRKLRELQFELSNTEYKQRRTIEEISRKKTSRERLAEDWDEVYNERFTDSICPTCHRELPEDEVEPKRNEFNLKKAKRLDEIERQNTNYGNEIYALEKAMVVDSERMIAISTDIENTEESIARETEALKALTESKKRQFEDKRRAIAFEIEESEALIKKYQENTSEMVNEVDAKIHALNSEMVEIDARAACNAVLERQNKRIEELKGQQVSLAKEYTAAERNLYLAENFIVAKVNMLNNRINDKFKYAKFKLFDKQINGGIAEACEVTYLGIPYKDLNNAARINIGLDVINTISKYYGITVPVLIDNAESVNDLFHTDAQQIRFYVSLDKELKFQED